MNWVNIFALVCALIGIVNGITGLKSMRSKEHPQAEISWKQPSLSPWRYETPTMVALTFHSLGMICLAAFILLGVTRNNVFTSFPNTLSWLLLSALAVLAIFYTAFVSGVVAGYHFAQEWISPASYGISGDGMWYGGMLVPWKSYSHYEVGPENGLISLYSHYSPLLRAWVLQPAPESFSRVLALIQKNLPSYPSSDDSIAWQRSPAMFILGMIVLVLALLLPIAWLWIQNNPLVWIYAFIAFFFVHYVGVKLITRFGGQEQTATEKGVAG